MEGFHLGNNKPTKPYSRNPVDTGVWESSHSWINKVTLRKTYGDRYRPKADQWRKAQIYTEGSSVVRGTFRIR